MFLSPRKSVFRFTFLAYSFLSLLVHSRFVAGAPVTWYVDSAGSSITLTIPDQPLLGLGTLQFRNQAAGTTWNVGRTAPVDGTIYTEFDLGSIKFLGNPPDALHSVDIGNYRPNPDAFDPNNTNDSNPDGQFTDTTTAPGAYGARLRGASFITVDVAYVGIRDVSYNATSDAIPIVDNQFDTSGIDLSATGLVDYDGLVAPIIGQLFPDFTSQSMTVFAGTSTGGNGTIEVINDDNWYKMTIPISVTVPMLAGTGFDINGTASGQIVAFAQYPWSTLINGDFETGYLTGWQWESDEYGVTSRIAYGEDSVRPDSGGGDYYVELFANAGTPEPIPGLATLSQSFFVSEGERLSFSAWHQQIGDARASVSLVDLSSGESFNLFLSGDGIVDDEATDWREFSFTFTASGAYRIEAYAFSGQSQTWLLLDDFQIARIPEPSTLVLSACAALALGGAGLRRRAIASRR